VSEPLAVLEFEVPLPPVGLSPNHVIGSIGARMAKHARYQEYLETVRLIALDAAQRAGWSVPARARISLEFGVRHVKGELKSKDRLARPYRPEDWDNAVAAFKAGQDGLVTTSTRVGVLVGDDHRVLECGWVRVNHSAGPWVRVLLEALEMQAGL
jgi:hypothetical protein